MSRFIGYVNENDMLTVREDNAIALDIINIAFGHIVDEKLVWNCKEDCAKGMERLRKLNPSIKIVLSVGGWGAGGFSEIARTEKSREKFAQEALELVQSTKLDGIDLDWECPGSSLAGIESADEDGVNYILLTKRMRKLFDTVNKEYMLTIAVGGDTYFTLQTDMGTLSENLDYVQLMTYDLQGGFQTVTGHHSALYHSRRNLYDVCAHKAVEVFSAAGVPMDKLIVGVPFYSRMWSGVVHGKTGLGLHAQTLGGYGPHYDGLLEDYVNKNGYVRYFDDVAKVPYLFNGDTFISYDDEESIGIKIEYIKERQLGGIMFWEYRTDKTGTLIPFIDKALKK